MACPICVSPEGTAISDGMRAGAGVLILVSTIVIGCDRAICDRLWAAEAQHEEPRTRMIERWLPAAASGHASALDAVLLSVHAHMLLIFVPGWRCSLIALVKFRKGANPEPRAQGIRGTWPAVAIGAVIVGDVIILATQALPAWAARNAPPPAGVQPVEIRIAAEQFAWNIHYPGPDGVFGRTARRWSARRIRSASIARIRRPPTTSAC